MQTDFTQLRIALQSPAKGLYALERMRPLLIEALKDWPVVGIEVANHLLPLGKPISEHSRIVIDALLKSISLQTLSASHDILKTTKMYELLILP